jgi:hypothetical protein
MAGRQIAHPDIPKVASGITFKDDITDSNWLGFDPVRLELGGQPAIS